MPAETSADRLERLKTEVKTAEKRYAQWAEQFKVDRLEDFVVKSMQRQLPGTDGKPSDKFGKDYYIVNMLSPALDARIPALMYQVPHAIVTAKEPLADDPQPAQAPAGGLPGAMPGPMGLPPELAALAAGAGLPMPAPPPPPPTAEQKAKLREDLLNTTIQSAASGFKAATEFCIRETFFRFGLAEVIFTAEYESTKKAADPEKPESDAGQEGLEAAPDDAVEPDASAPDADKIPKRIPKQGSERVKVKRIPARQVLVSANSKNALEECEWVGYWEWVYVGDVKKNPNFKNRTAIKDDWISGAPGLESDRDQEASKADGYREIPAPSQGMVKLIKLWHCREMKKYVWIEGSEEFLQDGKELAFINLAALKFEEILDQFLPVPVCYNWTGSQIAYNETRDTQRTHRRRANRNFAYSGGAFESEELAKLTSGQDMAFAKTNDGHMASNAIVPVQMAPMDPVHRDEVQLTLNELMQVTKAGSEQKGVASDSTATAANIAQLNKQVQDSADRDKVAAFLEKLCMIILKTIEQNFTLPQVIKTTVDLGTAGAQAEADKQTAVWRKIEMDTLGDLDYEVTIDVESLSPPNSTIKAQQATAMLATLSNPNVLTLFGIPEAEPFIRKYLQTQGFRSEEEVQGIMATARAFLAIQQQQAQMAMMAKAGPPQPAGAAPAPPGMDPMAALGNLTGQPA